MFIGHYGLALAAKKAAPQTSLGVLVMAAQFLDLLWPIFLLLDVEHARIAPGITRLTPLDFYHYPYSHSLLAALVWGGIFSVVYWLTRGRRRPALVAGALVVSHWALDAVVHRPDLPLAPGSSRFFGLGLWNSVPATLSLEIGFFVAGIVLYLRTTVARNRTGRFGFWSFVVVLFGIYLANLFGPPPPDIRTVAWAGTGLWLFVFWSWWLDRNRTVRSA